LRRMLHGFAVVGVAPLTRACLNNPKVRVELSADSSDDALPQELKLRELGEQLQACVSYLSLRGFQKADLLLVRPKQKLVDRAVTLPHTLERQLAFNGAKTTGAKYKALNGTHCTHDDMFIARAIESRSKELKELEEKKATFTEAKEREDEAFALIARKETEGYPHLRLSTDHAKWKVPEINVLLKWKLGKIPTDVMLKAAKVTLWDRVKSSPTPTVPWSDEDEAKLQLLKLQVDVNDTELGKERQRLKQDAVASLGAMSAEEMDAFLLQFNAIRVTKSSDATETMQQGNGQADDETGEALPDDGQTANEEENSNQENRNQDSNESQEPAAAPRRDRRVRKPRSRS